MNNYIPVEELIGTRYQHVPVQWDIPHYQTLPVKKGRPVSLVANEFPQTETEVWNLARLVILGNHHKPVRVQNWIQE